MQNTAALTDVTLVCDDQKQVYAHKVILCASSSVLKSIIENFSQNSNSVIYLRGIQHEEMEAIINFIYLGETTFRIDRMSEFINVAKNLDVLEICNNLNAIEKHEINVKAEDNDVSEKNVKANFSFIEEEMINSDEIKDKKY